MNFKYVIQNIY